VTIGQLIAINEQFEDGANLGPPWGVYRMSHVPGWNMLHRRTALGIGFGGLITSLLPELVRANDDTGVFWTIEGPGGNHGILFGYQHVAAEALPDMLQDGERLLKTVSRVHGDRGDVQKTITAPNNTLKPLLPALKPELAQQLRAIVLAFGVPQDQVDAAPSVLVLTALLGEGAPPPKVTIAGALFQQARALGKPADVLMTEPESQKFLELMVAESGAIDMAVSNDTIAALLDLRREVGPIGAHCVSLYRARKVRELHLFSRRLTQQGLPPLIWKNPDAAATMYLDLVAPRIVPRLADGAALFFLDGGTFLIEHGLLARLREQGARVSAIA